VYDQGGNIIGYVHTAFDADYRDEVYSNNGTRKPADGSVWNVTEGIEDWLDYTAPESNDGSTPTIALKDVTASPAIDSGVVKGAAERYYTALILNAPSADQRGEPRDSDPDIGAYELTDRAPVDFNALDAKISEAKAIPQGSYTTATWNALQSAITNAEATRGTPNVTQNAVDKALAALTAAQTNLSPKASAGSLLALDVVAGGYENALSEADYTPESWADFAAALADARTIIDSPDDYSDADAFAAASALHATADSLVRKVDKSGLQDAISKAEDMLAPANVGKYVQVSVDNLQTVLAAAKVVLNNASATQDEVDTAFGNLADAVTEMFEAGDKAALQAFVNIVGGVTGASYTPVSYAEFTTALTDANLVLANPNALKEDVDTALTDLQNAFTGLIRKADTSALSASVAQAQGILANADDYVASSLAGLQGALDAAVVVLNNQNASQTEVNNARTELNALILSVRLKADRSALLTALNTASAINQSGYTPGSLAILSAAIQNGANIMNAPVESVTQEQVNQAVSDIYSAISALTPIENTVSNATDDTPGSNAGSSTNSASDSISSRGLSGGGTNTSATGGSIYQPAADTAALSESVIAPEAAAEGNSVIGESVTPLAPVGDAETGGFQVKYLVYIAVLAALVFGLLGFVIGRRGKSRRTE
jgi:hypothetical protein